MAQEKRSAFFQDFKVAPLPGSFMLIGIFAFLFAVFFLKHYSITWAVTIGFIGVIMFFASMISMTKAAVPEELLINEGLTEHKETIIYMTKKEYEEHLKKKKQEEQKKKAKKKTVKKPVKKSTKKKVTKKTTKTTKRKTATKKKATKKK